MRIFLLALTFSLASACTSSPPPEGTTVRGAVTAGPVCPVVTDPPDPACDDRPVAGAEIIIRNEAGEEVARATTDEEGTFAVVLAPGRYRVEPQPMEGLLGTAEAQELVVRAGVAQAPLAISYDTGIR